MPVSKEDVELEYLRQTAIRVVSGTVERPETVPIALMALFNYVDQLDRGGRTFKTSEEMSELNERVVGKIKEQVERFRRND